MPLIVERTTEREEAASYGLKDLLKEVAKGALEDLTRRSKGPPKPLSDQELLELALAPQAGMLKVVGLTKLLPKVIKAGVGTSASRGLRNVWKELLEIPESEWKRVKGVEWANVAPNSGEFRALQRVIKLDPTAVREGTPWHEFTHARQFIPERGKKMEGLGVTEEQASTALLKFWKELLPLAQDFGYSTEDFYRTASPIERHARGVTERMIQGRRLGEGVEDFGRVFRDVMEKELGFAERGMDVLGKPGRVKGIWEEVLSKRVEGVK